MSLTILTLNAGMKLEMLLTALPSLLWLMLRVPEFSDYAIILIMVVAIGGFLVMKRREN
ncbi:hypothetical protein HZC30_05820 [Candidatus Woesearchaeota archaeon]|nr:hypothetical protein [Candidatus Woesearchaeota archaeon]